MKDHLTGQEAVGQAWDGQRQTLAVKQGVTMPQTPNSSMILGYWNESRQNNDGKLAVTSGGSQPQFLPVPALMNQPSLLVRNWAGNYLNLVNVSADASTPIAVQAFGPGIPGSPPARLTVGTPLRLGALMTAQGTAAGSPMQLTLSTPTAHLSVLAVVGGPPDSSGNNAYVIGLNATADTGPGGAPPPPGYYATTTGHAYAFQFNWGFSAIYVVNLSPSTAAAVSVELNNL
jgi:hypothetical protein